jgi:glycosyltransferase involved in cell wall biosynthesis
MRIEVEGLRRCVVVTPTFNSERYLDETIASVVMQVAPSVQLDYHIQDGGSSDATAAIVHRWIALIESGALPRGTGRLTITFDSARDTGMYDGLRRGFAHVAPEAADVLTWINSDDRLAPGALATIARIFTDNPDCEFVGGRTALLDEQGSIVSINAPQAYSQAMLAAGRHDGRTQPFIMQEGTFFSGALWHAVDGIDPSFKLAGDWDLWRRMAQRAAYHSIDSVTAFHRRRPGQLSSDMARYHAEVDDRSNDGAAPVPAGQGNGALIRYDPAIARWIKAPFDTLSSRPPIAMLGGRRRDTCEIGFLTGFGAPEGPYPEFRLPAGIRWLVEDFAEIAVESLVDGLFEVRLAMRPTLAGLTLRLFLNGVALTVIALESPVADTDQIVEFPAWLGRGRNVLEIAVERPEPAATDPARSLLLVSCVVVAVPEPVRPAETWAALGGTMILVRAMDDPTALARTLRSVGGLEGATLTIMVDPDSDGAGVAAVLAPNAERIDSTVPGDAASLRERWRALGYATALEVPEGVEVRPGSLAPVLKTLRGSGAARAAGLTHIVAMNGDLLASQLPFAGDGPVLHALSAKSAGDLELGAALGARVAERAPASRADAPIVWVLEPGARWCAASPWFALAAALRLLGVDARHRLGAGGDAIDPDRHLVIAPGHSGSAAAWVARIADGEFSLAADGVDVAIPMPIDTESFRPRAVAAARRAAGLPAGRIALIDATEIEALADALPMVRDRGFSVVVLGTCDAAPDMTCLSLPDDAGILSHLLCAGDVMLVAETLGPIARAASACAVPVMDRRGRILSVEGVSDDLGTLRAGLDRIATSRAQATRLGAAGRAAAVRSASLNAAALALRKSIAAMPAGALRDWLERRDHLAAGTVPVPTDAPAGRTGQVVQRRDAAMHVLEGGRPGGEAEWPNGIALTAATATLLLRNAISAGALRLHLAGPAGSAWAITIDDRAPVTVQVSAAPGPAIRLAAALEPGLHRIELRAANDAARAGHAGTAILAWELLSDRPSARPVERGTRIALAPLAGREVVALERDGDWRPGEGFLALEGPHAPAGLFRTFRWTKCDGAAIHIRVDRAGPRTIDLAVSSFAKRQRLRLRVGETDYPWSAPMDGYIGRITHRRWTVDWPAGEVQVIIEMDTPDDLPNPRNLGILLLGISLA